MSRRRHARIPGTYGRRRPVLAVLPAIPDAAGAEVKNAIAIRNTANVEGRCPSCGVVGVVTADPAIDGLFHVTYEHGADCRALTDEASA